MKITDYIFIFLLPLLLESINCSINNSQQQILNPSTTTTHQPNLLMQLNSQTQD